MLFCRVEHAGGYSHFVDLSELAHTSISLSECELKGHDAEC